MIYFNCDYNEGAHPKILERLGATNWEQTPGYGEDAYCEAAARLIREKCERADAAVHFLVGGTQTNLTAVTAVLRPYQGVVSADTGHINTHETGAIEACGHKVLAIPSADGKVTAAEVEALCTAHETDATHEHMVQPGMLYLSHPTEVGTLYTRAELEALRAVCTAHRLVLYLDGARLGYGLRAPGSDVTLPLLADLCDLFYIGGTKQGALFGEALVIANPALQKDFRYLIKQKGGMLAKGRLLGIQFQTLMEDDLYLTMSRHAIDQAQRIRCVCEEKGIQFAYPPQTNQLFLILPDEKIAALGKSYQLSPWGRADEEHSIVRVCTSWATKTEHVDALLRDLGDGKC